MFVVASHLYLGLPGPFNKIMAMHQTFGVFSGECDNCNGQQEQCCHSSQPRGFGCIPQAPGLLDAETLSLVLFDWDEQEWESNPRHVKI